MSVARRLVRGLAAGLALFSLAAAAPRPSAPSMLPVPAAPGGGGETEVARGQPVAAAPLTRADVDAWLDGFMPYALEAGDIAGAQVAVVRDGKLLTARGFGYADVKAGRRVDPAATLFRLGSVAKLFTWTAVMQLVQAGKLDLDRDVNAYLDFRIPTERGRPITLRHLMTHTAGFAEQLKYLLADDPAKLQPLDRALKRFVPERLYPPGAMPAYSNYGAALAGYIVQRVSGEPFDRYVQRHVFLPLGMARSTFGQPLAGDLAPLLSKGYVRASEGPRPFEFVSLSPAGSLSAPATDMARFMIAHLAGGGPLLSADTARLMHAPANRPIPGLPAMALGFLQEDRNGERIVGHGGDTVQFHSDLHLYLDRGVGLYVSFNSVGREGAAHSLRERLFAQFTDRYFPAPATGLPTRPTAQEHGRALAGHYVSSRATAFTFGRLLSVLQQTAVGLNEDGTISVSGLTNPAGVEKRWREVGPWQWREVGGSDRLAAVVADGRVRMFSVAGFAPIFEFLPAPAALDAGWIMPLLAVALLVMAVTAVAWPARALVRRRYGHRPEESRNARRVGWAIGATAWLALLIVAGWLAIIQSIGADLAVLDGRLDPWIRLLQLLSLLFVAGAVLAAWRSVRLLRHPRWRRAAAARSVPVALSALLLAFLLVDLGLLTPALNY